MKINKRREEGGGRESGEGNRVGRKRMYLAAEMIVAREVNIDVGIEVGDASREEIVAKLLRPSIRYEGGKR